MDDDERIALSALLEGEASIYYTIAAQLRADGERIKALEAERQWQPIETAPKDGSRFLAYEPREEYQHYECWWQSDLAEWEGWMDPWDNEPNPTRWQPLPKPPGGEGE